MFLQNKSQFLIHILAGLAIYQSIPYKQLFKIFEISYYHEYIWLGIATVSFTTMSK